MVKFWLGTHQPSWLGETDVPLFFSRRRLAVRKTLPRATGPWALDSGGFSELSLHGRWTTDPRSYVAEVRRWREEVGNLAWAAAMDWMCEPWLLEKTGLSVARHQELTVDNFVELMALAPDLPWVPVLQGWRFADYMNHAEEYARRGVDLTRLDLVGLGSVCRRQGTAIVEDLVWEFSRQGLRIHGFGIKLQGLRRAGARLASADSMAWSLRARRSPPLPGCRHASCANCLRFALGWRERVLETVERAEPSPTQEAFDW